MKIKKFSNKFIQGLLASDDVMDEAVLRGYADNLPYEMSQADDVAASFGLTLEKWATSPLSELIRRPHYPPVAACTYI